MKKNKLLITIGTVVVLTILVIVKYGANKQPVMDGTVRVGVILPLTGVSADLGAPILQAMQLAEKHVNQGLKTKLVLDVEDGKSTASGTITAYQKIMLRDPDAIVVFGDVPCNNLAPLANKNTQPIIALGAAAEDIPRLSPHYFRLWVTSDVSSKQIAQYLKSVSGMNRIAVLYSDNSYGSDFLECLKGAITKEGLNMVAIESFDVSAQSVRSQVDKLLARNPDAIVVLGFGTGYLAAFNQLKESKYQGAILTDETITIPAYFNAVVNEGAGIVFSATAFDPYVQEGHVYSDFIKPFQEAIGTIPNAHSVFGFVSIEILADALNRVGNDKEKIEEGLRSMHGFDSIIGNISYTRDRELEVQVFMKQMIGAGHFTVIK